VSLSAKEPRGRGFEIVFGFAPFSSNQIKILG
jgi:hypothetical protein